jgi:hypothetical protein
MLAKIDIRAKLNAILGDACTEAAKGEHPCMYLLGWGVTCAMRWHTCRFHSAPTPPGKLLDGNWNFSWILNPK